MVLVVGSWCEGDEFKAACATNIVFDPDHEIFSKFNIADKLDYLHQWNKFHKQLKKSVSWENWTLDHFVRNGLRQNCVAGRLKTKKEKGQLLLWRTETWDWETKISAKELQNSKRKWTSFSLWRFSWACHFHFLSQRNFYEVQPIPLWRKSYSTCVWNFFAMKLRRQ